VKWLSLAVAVNLVAVVASPEAAVANRLAAALNLFQIFRAQQERCLVGGEATILQVKINNFGLEAKTH
jgi:hypothetical protein